MYYIIKDLYAYAKNYSSKLYHEKLSEETFNLKTNKVEIVFKNFENL